MRDAFVLVDVVQTFEHEDGERLLESFRGRHDGFVAALERARADGLPVIYANDNFSVWDGDAPRLVQEALAGAGGGLLRPIAPRAGETFVVKPRYSAFDHTPLELILRELEIERLLLGGMSTEGCVAQSAIGARELSFKVTVLADACATIDEGVERVAFDYLDRVAGVFVERGRPVDDA
ncbi:MAG TPA: isochorismatase family cysteine hydrolase [Gaiellaceae bacterium]|nr:isochorismatase family cysteine hydrolase [Gaiellaceae bacterium]